MIPGLQMKKRIQKDEVKDSQRWSNESTATSMISDETRFHDELSRAPSLQKADSYFKLKLGVR